MQPSVPLQPAVIVQPDSLQLDALIAELKRHGDSELLVEHLQTAHAYLHGAMPEECAHNLELARRASDGLSNKSLEGEVKRVVAKVLGGLHPSAHEHWRHHSSVDPHSPPATAEGLGEFFHGHSTLNGGVSLGIFYPKKHVVAIFPSYPTAKSGREILSLAGFRTWEAIAVPGAEVNQYLKELREHHSLWADLAREVSRFLDTEAGLADSYGRWARGGAGFLLAYSPTQVQAEGIFELLKPLDPLAVHWFMAGYIRHLL